MLIGSGQMSEARWPPFKLLALGLQTQKQTFTRPSPASQLRSFVQLLHFGLIRPFWAHRFGVDEVKKRAFGRGVQPDSSSRSGAATPRLLQRYGRDDQDRPTSRPSRPFTEGGVGRWLRGFLRVGPAAVSSGVVGGFVRRAGCAPVSRATRIRADLLVRRIVSRLQVLLRHERRFPGVLAQEAGRVLVALPRPGLRSRGLLW